MLNGKITIALFKKSCEGIIECIGFYDMQMNRVTRWESNVYSSVYTLYIL